MYDREIGRATAFCRSLGFRRVGNSNWSAMTIDHEHSSHKLAAQEDFDPPNTGPVTLHSILQPFRHITDPPELSIEQFFSQESLEDPDFLGVLHNCFQKEGSAAACWEGTDKYGNNILHIASKMMHTACVEWILKQDFGRRLLQLRNHRGETPIEYLVFYLEELRTKPPFWSDKFTGHNSDGVRCLVLLKGFPDLESFVKAAGFHALEQLIRGCTCGKCIEGVISPRTSYALSAQANSGYDLLLEDLDSCSGPAWVTSKDMYLKFLPAKLRGNLATNKSIREGFVNLWKYIALCLEHDQLPNTPNVLEALRKDGEWPPATKNFLNRGGTVENAFLAICEFTMAEDEWAGDGWHAKILGEDIAKLPECRNDHEFGFVSGSCGFEPLSRGWYSW